MRVGAVGVHRDHRRIVSDQMLAGEGLHDPLLNFKLMGAAVPHPPADLLECRRRDRVN